MMYTSRHVRGIAIADRTIFVLSVDGRIWRKDIGSTNSWELESGLPVPEPSYLFEVLEVK
jgi:hypothetical protein